MRNYRIEKILTDNGFDIGDSCETVSQRIQRN